MLSMSESEIYEPLEAAETTESEILTSKSNHKLREQIVCLETALLHLRQENRVLKKSLLSLNQQIRYTSSMGLRACQYLMEAQDRVQALIDESVQFNSTRNACQNQQIQCRILQQPNLQESPRKLRYSVDFDELEHLGQQQSGQKDSEILEVQILKELPDHSQALKEYRQFRRALRFEDDHLSARTKSQNPICIEKTLQLYFQHFLSSLKKNESSGIQCQLLQQKSRVKQLIDNLNFPLRDKNETSRKSL